ncbi:MAG TPA: hypothetical protein VM490_17330 [Armatimonadaceae bacterium]|nr:hypothetical protein [Armatimonadaceae bacterium]
MFPGISALAALFTRSRRARREETFVSADALAPDPTTTAAVPPEPEPVDDESVTPTAAPPPARLRLTANSEAPLAGVAPMMEGADGGAPAAALCPLTDDLRMLLNMAGSTLTRAVRPTAGAKGQASALGPVNKGLELAEGIEQKARGRLLETNLKKEDEPRLLTVVQNAQDAAVALRAARYAWQIGVLLTEVEGGVGVNARLKRLATSALEMNGRVVGVLEGQEEAKVVASQFRAFLDVQVEVANALRGNTTFAARLGRAALFSLGVCAESMTRIAARAALPDLAPRHLGGAARPDMNDGVLNPLPRY